MNTTDEPLWDANDVARFMKASRSWVYQRVEAGKLPCVRIGGLLRFAPAQIRAFANGESPTNVIAMKRTQPHK